MIVRTVIYLLIASLVSLATTYFIFTPLIGPGDVLHLVAFIVGSILGIVAVIFAIQHDS